MERTKKTRPSPRTLLLVYSNYCHIRIPCQNSQCHRTDSSVDIAAHQATPHPCTSCPVPRTTHGDDPPFPCAHDELSPVPLGTSRGINTGSIQTGKRQHIQPAPGNHATRPSTDRCRHADRSTDCRQARCQATSAASACPACQDLYFSSVTSFHSPFCLLDSIQPPMVYTISFEITKKVLLSLQSTINSTKRHDFCKKVTLT